MRYTIVESKKIQKIYIGGLFMLKEVLELGKIVKKTSVFVSGVVVGSVGLKVLASKLDATVSQLKQHADDVLAEANDLYVEEKTANLATVETSEQ